MFCEKCGNQLDDNAKFCDKCGASTTAQTKPQEAPVAPTAEQPTTPVVPVQPTENFVSQSAPVAPKAPKKPISKKLKKIIIFGSAGLVVIIAALIAVFGFIIPEANKIHVNDYVIMSFDKGISTSSSDKETEQFDGHNKVYVRVDKTKLLTDKGLAVQSTFVDSALEYMSITAKVKGQESTEETTSKSKSSKNSSTGNGDSYIVLENVKSDDVIEVTISWDPTPLLDTYENQLGRKIDRSEKTFELKVSEQLENQGLTLKPTVTVDLLGKIVDDDGKNHIKATGSKRNTHISIEDFEFEEGGFKFSFSGEDREYTIKKANGEKLDSTVSVRGLYSYSSYKAGEDLELSISYNGFENEGLFFEKAELKTKVPTPTPLTMDEAKSKVSEIKKNVEDDGYKLEAVYYLEGSDSTEYSNIIVVEKSKAYGKTTYYSGYVYKDCYIEDDTLKYSDSDYASSEKTAKEFEANISALSDSSYKKTTIS